MRPTPNTKRTVVSNSDVFKRKRHARIKKLTLLVSIVCLLLLGIFIGLSRFEKLRLHTVSVIGNEVLPPDDIQLLVEQKISGYYLWIFPKDSIMLYPKRSIERELYNKYSRIASVSLDRVRTRELEVSVSEYKGIYLWCGFGYDRNAPCYFVDEKGFIFNEAPFYSGTLFFKFFGSEMLETENEVIGKSMFPDAEFNSLISFKKVLEEFGLHPFALEVEKDMYVYYLENPGSRPTRVLILKETDLSESADNLESALMTEPLHTLFKKGLVNMDYIDVRFKKKVLYKSFDREPVAPPEVIEESQ